MDKHHRAVAREPGQQLPEAQPLLRVKARRRLVEDKQPGVAEQRLRHAEPTAHAARQRADRLARHVREADLRQHPRDLGLPLAGVGDLFQYRDVVEERGHREVPVIAELLRQVPERPADPQPPRAFRRVLPEHPQPSRVRPGDRGEDGEERGLPGPVRAEDAGDPGRYRQVDLVKGDRRAVAPGQPLDHYRRFHPASST